MISPFLVDLTLILVFFHILHQFFVSKYILSTILNKCDDILEKHKKFFVIKNYKPSFLITLHFDLYFE